MQVRCPYCSSVFESDRAGIRFCPSCGKQIQIPEGAAPGAAVAQAGAPSLAPAGVGGLPPSGTPGAGTQSVRQPTPWERRSELGALKALLETLRQSLFTPEPFWSSVEPNGPAGDAFSYALIIWVVGGVIQFPIRVLQSAQAERILDQLSDQLRGLPPGAQRFLELLKGYEVNPIHGALSHFAFYVFMAVVGLLISSAIVHLFCMLLGCSKNGYWATFRVYAYASGPSLITGIPCIGVIGAIYMLVLHVWGIARLQETSVGKAAAAVLLPWVVICCCGCLGLLGLGAMGASFLHRMNQ